MKNIRTLLDNYWRRNILLCMNAQRYHKNWIILYKKERWIFVSFCGSNNNVTLCDIYSNILCHNGFKSFSSGLVKKEISVS